jgi:tRNA pseudouridine38-40 synthase
LLVEYDGSDFAGFQRQVAERGRTVQGALETALARIAGHPVSATGAGRTDAGVHASGQVVSFRSAARLDAAAWGRALNAHLPPDVAIRAAAPVADEFHARYSALTRSYRYRLFCDRAPSPLRERYALRWPRPLDAGAMEAAAQSLLGEHDFAAFGSSPRDERGGTRGHCVRTLSVARCHWASCEPSGEAQLSGDACEFDFTANAFLTGMVRRFVGTLLLVGDGRLSVDGFAAILAARAKAHPGAAVPARGLCLVGVTYPAGAVEWESIR